MKVDMRYGQAESVQTASAKTKKPLNLCANYSVDSLRQILMGILDICFVTRRSRGDF